MKKLGLTIASRILKALNVMAATTDIQPSPNEFRKLRAPWNYIALAIGAITIISMLAIFVPWQPSFPQPDLDSSWAFSMNEAVARGKIFGRDIIFTFGPYASVYTKQFHPATDELMMWGCFLLACAFAIGIVSLGYKGRWWLAPVIPLCLALTPVSDGFFLVLPLLLLSIVGRIALPQDDPLALPIRFPVIAVLYLLIAAIALLPLVKGTNAISCFFTGGIAFVVLCRHRVGLAVTGAMFFLASMIFLWVASGQPILALPNFFLAQAPIVSGYTEAMATLGSNRDIIIFIVSGLGLLAVSYWYTGIEQGLDGILCNIAIAATLYLAFKAGFVRHDGHAVIAAGTLVLTGVLIAYRLPPVVALATVAITLSAWFSILSNYTDTSLPGIAHALKSKIIAAESGIARRLAEKSYGPDFDAQLAAIRKSHPLQVQAGTSDIYPVEQSILFANQAAWAPRPIIQSYSAYEPSLIEKNASHLLGPSAPDHVFFRIAPIDSRFPTLEDGKSWLALLSRYRFSRMDHGFAAFDKGIDSAPSPDGEILVQKTFHLGEEIPLPGNSDLIWAEVDIRLSVLGKLTNFAFKPPTLAISIVLPDETPLEYRFVSTMAKTGFLISPFVVTAQDVVKLLSSRRSDHFQGRAPRSFKISVPSGNKWAWQPDFTVRLRKLNIPAQPGVDASLFNPLNPQSAPSLQSNVGGVCAIDTVDGSPAIPSGMPTNGNSIEVEGWSVFSQEHGIAPDDVFVAVTDAAGYQYIAKANKTPRPDVNAHFGYTQMGDVGFAALIDTTSVKHPIRLQVAYLHGGEFKTCPLTVKLTR